MSDEEKWPVLDVVLFNTHSSDDVTTTDRQDCMKTVLDDILEQSGPNLFVLCQNNITRPKHNILCRKMGIDERPRPKKEADIYYRSAPGSYIDRTENCHVKYLDSGELTKANEACITKFGTNNDFSISRLTVCKLMIPFSSSGRYGRLLLASWHGPANIGQPAKIACYDRLFCFLQHLCREEWCWAFIVGGEFNMKAEVLEEHEGRGTIVCHKAAVKGRESQDKSGCVVFWPRYELELAYDVSVLRPQFRGRRPRLPFDYNVLLCRFGDPALIEETQSKKKAP